MIDLGVALQISVVGMGLVFGAILLLWGGMALLVRLTAELPAARDPAPEAAPAPNEDAALKRRAAVAAVALALARAREAPRAVPHSLGAPVSAWQSAHRAGLLKGQQERRR